MGMQPEVRVSGWAVVEAKYPLDHVGEVGRNLDGACASAIAALFVLILVQFDAECLLHGSRGSIQRDGAALNLVTSLQHHEIVFRGKLSDFFDVGRVGAILFGKLFA